MSSLAVRLTAAALSLISFYFTGCEETYYVAAPEPPPAVYGYWEATNPEVVGLDFISLDVDEDGHYHYFANIDHFEMDEVGHWNYNGYGEFCFYSEYINGHHEVTSYEADFDLLECNLLKAEYEDTECSCPLYFERDCH